MARRMTDPAPERDAHRPNAKAAAALAIVQLGDGVACAIPTALIADALDAVNCPTPVRKALPAIKVASGLGLLVGIRRPRIGFATSLGLVGYFVCAIGFHIKAKDQPKNALSAFTMLGASAAMARNFAASKQA